MLLRSALATLLACAVASAQTTSRNVTLLANFFPNDRFSDIWGYVDPRPVGSTRSS